MRYLNLAGYVAIPLAIIAHFWLRHRVDWEPVLTFSLAALGVVPLAHLMGQATEHLAEKTGPTWGGLVNATFGNAAELIIGIIGLTKGLNEVVKASLTGSILGNLLLVSGAAMVAGGWNREKQRFSKEAAQANAGLLALAVAAMLFPAIFDFTYRGRDAEFKAHEHGISIGTSIILLVVYGLGLLFTLRTHSHIFSRPPAENPEDPPGISGCEPSWTVRKSLIMLLIASAGVGVLAEFLVGSAELMAERLGWNSIFVGVVLLAIIGNAAEHSTALMLARRNDMDTAMAITHQSSLQIALFATPVMVLLSAVFVALHMKTGQGVRLEALDLVFSPMEVVAVVVTVAIVVVLGLDGESNWFEGALLLALYVILGIAFFYIPEAPRGGYDGKAPDAAHGVMEAPPPGADGTR
jgi:Ca2+:H+ antiporter